MDHFTFRIPHHAAGSLMPNTVADARQKATDGLQNLLRRADGRRFQQIAYIYKLVEVVAPGEEPKPTSAPPLRITGAWHWLRDIVKSNQEKLEAANIREVERLGTLARDYEKLAQETREKARDLLGLNRHGTDCKSAF